MDLRLEIIEEKSELVIEPDGENFILEVISNSEIILLTEIEQGLPGVDGEDFNLTGFAPQAISGQRVVILDENNQIFYADCSDLSRAYQIVGLTQAAIGEGESGRIITFGEFSENGWNWIPNQPLFLGENGFITQTVLPTAIFIQRIGKSLSPTKIFINLEPPIFIG